MKNKGKRIAAIVCVILLVGMYVSTLVFACLKKPWAFQCLKASVFLTIVIPVFLYAVILVKKMRK